MQVCVSTWSRFHLFDLAQQLYRCNSLHSLCSTLPRYKVNKDVALDGVRKNKIHTFPPFFLCQIALGRMVENTWLNELAGVLTTRTYQEYVKAQLSQNIDAIDAYIAISGSGYKGGELMTDHGKIYCFDRGSTEINHQLAVMKGLHDQLSLPCRNVATWLIENETKEAELATAITVPSGYCKQTFIDKGYHAGKIHVIPYGVNLKEFYPDYNRDQPSKKQIIFCGQFSIRKGAHLLVEYFRSHPHQNARLTVVGSIHPNLHRLYGTYSIPNIDFHGVVPRSQVREYMQQAKALILPSYEEGLALVILQALACGIPVIASVQSGATEYVREGYNGFILEDLSTRSIHHALVKLYSLMSDEQEQMSHNCRSSVQGIGGWDQYGRQWIKLLNTLLHPTTA